MANWHGYLLLEKPAGLSLDEWQTALQALYVAWNRLPDAAQPAEQLHYRSSLDGEKVIVEASFDIDQVTLQRAAEIIQQVLPQYSLVQVTNALTGHLTWWGLSEPWAQSNASARVYLAVNEAEWQLEE